MKMQIENEKTENEKILLEIMKEKEERNNTKLLTLLVTAPAMIYTGLGKKPPKILKAAIIITAMSMMLDALTKDKK